MQFLARTPPKQLEDSLQVALQRELTTSKALVASLDEKLASTKERASQAETQVLTLESELQEVKQTLKQSKNASIGLKERLEAELELARAEHDWQSATSHLSGERSLRKELLDAQQRTALLDLELQTAHLEASQLQVGSRVFALDSAHTLRRRTTNSYRSYWKIGAYF
jgi:chromosome segregation ATPase